MVDWIIRQVERERDVVFEPDAELAAQYAVVSGLRYIIRHTWDEVEDPEVPVTIEPDAIQEMMQEEFEEYTERFNALDLPDVDSEIVIPGLSRFASIISYDNFGYVFSRDVEIKMGQLTTSAIRVLLYEAASGPQSNFITVHHINRASEQVFDAGLFIDWS